MLPAAGPSSRSSRPFWAQSGGNYNSRRALDGAPHARGCARAVAAREELGGPAPLASRGGRCGAAPVRWVLRGEGGTREWGPGWPGRGSRGRSGCEGRARTACGGQLSRGSALLSSAPGPRSLGKPVTATAPDPQARLAGPLALCLTPIAKPALLLSWISSSRCSFTRTKHCEFLWGRRGKSRRKAVFCPVLGDIYCIILMKIAVETFCLQVL